MLDGEILAPVFTTRVERVVRIVHVGEAVIEAALDRGELSADGRRAPVCELELELKSGQPPALFDLARQLAKRVPLRLSLISKAERGYGLAVGGDYYSGWSQTSYRYNFVSDVKLHNGYFVTWVEKRLQPQTVLRVEVANLFERGIRFNTRQYDGPRSDGKLLYVDDRDLKPGQSVYIRVRHTFGA